MSEPETFGGFVAPDANFTPTPNQFFDVIVGYYDSCVVTVVAVLIRETLGWKNKHTGARKIEAALAQSDFVRHGLSKESARKGIRLAIEAGFIVQTAAHSPRDPARYALRWEDAAEQQQAIEQERKAFGVETTSAGGVAADGERRRKVKGKKGGIRVLNSRPLKIRALKTRSLENVPHIDGTLKETDSGKEIKESLKHVNVVPEGLSTHLSRHKAESLLELLRVTGDNHSDPDNNILYDIAHKAACDDCWTKALDTTRKRIEKGSKPVDRPGGYFRTILACLLAERQVFVPSGTAAERADIHAAAAASLKGEDRNALA